MLSCSMIYRERQGASIEAPCRSLSKKSGWSWAFSDRYGRMGKGDGAVKIYAQNYLQAPAE